MRRTAADVRIAHATTRAFTLIELLVVISIIGLLASVVLSAVQGARARGVIGAAQEFDHSTFSGFYSDTAADWEFGDSGTTVSDQSGNNNVLTLTSGSQVQSAINPFSSGNAVQINATQFAQAPTPLNNPPTGNFSISFWVYTTNNNGVDIISNYNLTQNGSWKLSFQDPSTGFVFNYRAIGSLCTGSLCQAQAGVLQVNQWYQIVATCNNQKIGFYVNGKQAGASISIAPNFCSFYASNIVMNGGASGATYYLDNVRIYRQPLPLS